MSSPGMLDLNPQNIQFGKYTRTKTVYTIWENIVLENVSHPVVHTLQRLYKGPDTPTPWKSNRESNKLTGVGFRDAFTSIKAGDDIWLFNLINVSGNANAIFPIGKLRLLKN